MTWFTITIYVALAAFTATYAVPASARAERALSQRSSSSLFEPAMSAATEAPESAAAAPTQQRGAASQAPAPNSIATGTEAVTLPAVSPPTGTKKGTSPANTLIKQATCRGCALLCGHRASGCTRWLGLFFPSVAIRTNDCMARTNCCLRTCAKEQ